MSQPTEPLDEEASRTPMWLPAVGLAILFGIAVVVLALPSAPAAQGATTPVAATGDAPTAPSDDDSANPGRVKPPEGNAAPSAVAAADGAPGAAAAPRQPPPLAPPAQAPGGG
ncbi:MAG: hypothetical protein IT379_22445 [Deltaproteobacteria bacterium]|nr:hypothetical protein [Deltaproteobacteria bacterium]